MARAVLTQSWGLVMQWSASRRRTLRIAIVAQDPTLVHGTVEANLRMAKPDATQAEIEAACRAANPSQPAVACCAVTRKDRCQSG